VVTRIAAGGDRVEDVRVLAEDKGLEKLLGAPFPSPDALLDFLGQFHDPKCWEGRPPEKQIARMNGLVDITARSQTLPATPKFILTVPHPAGTDAA
jgi:hypothetical protein